MTTTHVITEAHKALVEGQNAATESWPSELDARQKLIRAFFEKEEEQRAAVKKAQDEAKKKIGAGDMQKRLMKDYGWRKPALDIIGKLRRITDPMERAATSRQVYEAMKDEGFLIPELFDLGRAGMSEGAAADAADKPVFDNTPKGSQTKGLGKTAPETVPDAQTQTGTGPGLDLADALAKLEAYRAANPPKAGAKKKELKELEAAVAAAQAAAPALPEVNPGAPSEADLPELPKTDGPVAPEIKAGVDESAAHIAGQVEGAAPPVTPKKRSGGKKATEAKAPEVTPPASTKPAVAGPDGPDDDEADPFAPVPHIPRTVGGNATANTTRLG